MIIGLALYVVRRMRHLARRVCIALSYVRGIIEPFAGFRSHSEGGPSFREIVCGRESYRFRRGRNRRDKPVTYHRVRQHVYDRCHILSYARHTRVSAASCCCRGGMHALTGIRDAQARKRICQDFRDCSKCASPFHMLIVSIYSLSRCSACRCVSLCVCVCVFLCMCMRARVRRYMMTS